MRQEQYQQKIDILQSSTAKITIGAVNSSTLKLSSLKRVKRSFSRLFNMRILDLEISGNPELEKFELLSLETVEMLTIFNNPKWFLSEFSETFEKVAKIDRIQSVVECNLPDNETVEDFNKIRLCTHLQGNLTLANVSDTDAALFRVQEMRGCITVRNTTLTSLWFLDRVNVADCNGTHLITGNPNLCARGYLRDKGPVTRENNAEKGCREFWPLPSFQTRIPPTISWFPYPEPPFSCKPWAVPGLQPFIDLNNAKFQHVFWMTWRRMPPPD